MRRDANHTEIVTALKQLGCSVLDLAAVGGGCPDLLVAHHGRTNVLVEVKNPARKTRGDNAAKTLEKQALFREAWKGPVIVVDSVEAAAKLFGAQV